jgi:hypothetical protein
MSIYHTKDNSFKLILGNHQLFVEFLKDFIPVPSLKSITPEDVEDLSERFIPLDQDAKDSDTVKRIRLKGDTPLYVITVVEHESKVNFRSPFKMLLYICLVLNNYEKQFANKKAPQTKDFRYPPVLPIVFYDGPTRWTSERNFRDRTELAEEFWKYIPSFEYELVDLNQYSREDIIEFGDALSFIMLIDKVRTSKEGIEILRHLPKEYVEQLQLKIPEDLSKLMIDVITVLLDRLKAPREGIAAVTDILAKKEYGTMFDVLVESVLKDRREAAKKIRAVERKARREKLEGARKQKQMGISPDIIVAGFGLSRKETEEL